MQYSRLRIDGAYRADTRTFTDDRGVFLEWFKDAPFAEATGGTFAVAQANCSVSNAGVLRGIHFADVPPGQAKLVTCVAGAVLDVVVDLRIGSPTYGQWDAVMLDDVDRAAIYLAEGLGHAFLSLADGSTVVYLCSAPYAPDREHEVSPLDPAIGIDWPTRGRDGRTLEIRLSPKDAAAPTLAQARESGLLPTMEQVAAWEATR
ncbi:dTDP-4-dehydrorhamnose 3,5-epimerase family protein [Demequina sp. NBRC 110053]|uniref:dTDP-4-dehydrorhamnose 3,5-epimerase family protein n=1 Tax=Demequina sp. NBRC 110053 TaxID=1570342 RepID=UPI0009FD30BE|nr:dTDP-4-dehydrorhamnose 3,5-epimerase [Demequina sp. NBRC 110053]